MRFLLRLVINALIVLGVAYLLPNFFVGSFWWALMFAIILGIVNAVIRPVIGLISLPITILTLGLFSLVINALMVWLAALFVPGIEIVGFWTYLWAGLILWVGSWLTNQLLKD
ncbi:MAG: phage holin family protein [Patescibacteria group bacterium]